MSIEASSDTIGSRLAKTASRFPGRVALVERASIVNFRQLDSAATAIAHGILAAGDDRPGRVGLFFENKIPAIKSIFGAGRSGHAYVALDAGDPEERLRSILSDCEPVALLTEADLLDRARTIAPPGCTVVDVACVQTRDQARPLPDVSPEAPVYVCYTSGSTGRPKGAIQTHTNLLFFADAYAQALKIAEHDRLSLLYALSFNASNMDIFGGLLRGAALCAYDMRREGIAELADWLDRERITLLHAVPTVFRELGKRLAPGRLLPHLRTIDLGGESVFASDVDLFRAHTLESCVFVNQLASTEVGLIAQHMVGHSSPRAPGSIIPAGRCPRGVRVEIRREDGSAAPAGETGEIVVCSPHVSPGYWQRRELDAAAFSVDPLKPEWRRYASGDFGYLDSGGDLHFLGRKGGRVKVRGHTVELMEIEAALSACAGVMKAAVLAVEQQGDSARLVAYVVAQRDIDRDPRLMRRRLARHVPSYMLPSDFVFMDELPLTASGKIDRLALASIEPSSTGAARRIEAPHDDIERAVAGIFEQLLRLAPIGRDDDFFMLGGDSLLGVELQIRVRDATGSHISNLHEDATVAGIASAIRRDRAASPQQARAMPVLFPLWPHGSEHPLFLVHGRHGQAFVSPHFMRLLGNNQPVWVFQARGLDGLREPHRTVEEMAAEYLTEMRKQRPRGPYFLGALCAGAYIASAMARTLRDTGEAVLPLLLLDPPDRLVDGGYTQMTEESFIKKMTSRRALGRTAGPINDPEYMKAVLRVARAFDHAIARHKPQPYDGPVYMLSSRQRIQGTDHAALGEIFTGRLKRYEVGATHADALDPRNPAFASQLLRCIDLIRGGGTGAPVSVCLTESTFET